MGRAFAPMSASDRSRSALSRIVLVLVCACVVLSGALAQETKQGNPPASNSGQGAASKSGGDGKTKGAANKEALDAQKKIGTAKIDEAQAKSDAAAAENAAINANEIVFDPNMPDAMLNTFPALPDVPLSADDEKLVIAMSDGQGQLNPALIERYVAHFAAELTKKVNIDALLKQDVKAKNIKAIEIAGVRLQDPIRHARTQPAFLAEYRKALLKVLPKLLDGHAYARTQAIIPLAMCKSPEAGKVMVEQIANDKQILTVKIWSLRGITLLADRGRTEAVFRGQAQADAADAVVALLMNPDLPWFVKIRAAETLGSLRTSSIDIRAGKVEAAEAMMLILSDPKQRSETRALAGWALGMMRVPDAVGKYNHSVVAHHLGRAASDIAKQIDRVYEVRVAVEDDPKDSAKKKTTSTLVFNAKRVELLANLLSTQITRAFIGETGIRDSGLTRAPGADAQVRLVETQIKALAARAVELSRASGTQIPLARLALKTAEETLTRTLDQSRPSSWTLIAKGTEFPIGGVKPPAPAPASKKAAADSEKSR